MVSVLDLEREFIEKSSWLVQENANRGASAAAALFWYVAKHYILEEICKYLPPNVIKAHKEGWLHLNKLLDGAFYFPYCGGFGVDKVIAKGLITPQIVSRPPKHLDSAVDQLANFIHFAALERTGAVGFSPALRVLAPFVKFDKLDYKQIKQNIQRLVYNLNYGNRVSVEPPFSNFVEIFTKEYDDLPAYVGGRIVGKLGDFRDEFKLIFKAFLEVLLEGDAYGRPFTFPIPTVSIGLEFLKLLEEDHELDILFWRVVAERGAFYFLNNFAIDVSGIFSFCCRLTSNFKRIMEYLHMARGTWAMPPATGSICYATINLPRVAMEAMKRGDEKYIWDKLYELCTLAREYLQFLRRRYIKLHRLGLYPISRIYIDEFNPFKYYYNTIAVTGMAEYVAIVLNEPNLWNVEANLDGREWKNDIISIYRKTFEFINKVLAEFEEEDRVLYNLEEAPAESSSYRFALLDWKLYPEFRQFIPRGRDPVTGREEPFYTSQLTPPYTNYRLETQVEIEGACQKLFTGGVMKHLFVHKPLEPEYVKKLIIKLAMESGMVYFSYTPTQSICLDCGYRTIALIWECPRCGSTNIEQWSRIVGYYRPIRNWNPGRRSEFVMRKDVL